MSQLAVDFYHICPHSFINHFSGLFACHTARTTASSHHQCRGLLCKLSTELVERFVVSLFQPRAILHSLFVVVAGAIQLAAKTLFQNGEIEFFPTLLSAFVDNDKAFAKGSFTVLNLDGNDVKASGGVRVIAAEPINVANRTVFTVKYPFRISAALPKGKQLLASIRVCISNFLNFMFLSIIGLHLLGLCPK